MYPEATEVTLVAPETSVFGQPPQLWRRRPRLIPNNGLELRLLTGHEFEDLLAAELVPGRDRDGHRRLWGLLAANDDLAQRALDALKAWQARAQLVGDRRAAARFQDAWNRLTRIRSLDLTDQPLSLNAATFTGALTAAIGQHREQVAVPLLVDEGLWQIPAAARGRIVRKAECRGSRYWPWVPSFTQQLLAGLQAHARCVAGLGRQADRMLAQACSAARGRTSVRIS